KADEPRNTLFVLDYNGVTIAHLGRLNRVPTQAEVEALGNVNIVLVPVGGEGVLNAAKAAEVISLLEPSLVVPMLYAMPGSTVKFDPLNKFLKEMGLSSTETRPSLKIVRSSDLPDETQVVILDIQKGS
ncbi:MAG: MBL fold metallo-hydrolase, partial [bacterium]